jgi:hypothetical protein
VLRDEGHFLLFDPQSRAAPLLEDFFASDSPSSSKAWSSGTVVDDDRTVEAAFEESGGAQPFGAMSGAFRWLVDQSARNDAA